MSPDPQKTDSTQPLKSQEIIAVVGSGPVGVHLVNELFHLDYPGTVLLFGDEPHAPYNRVKLSNLLDGSCDWQNLTTEVRLKDCWQAHYHTQIVHINLDDRVLTDGQGNHYRFDKLVLATGSKPHIPAIPGNKLSGVFVFRNLEDAEKLLSRQMSSRHTIVIGGGLLGIETARAMAKYGTDVTLIHHSPMLMNRQLDERSSNLLVEDLRKQRVEVRLSSAVLAIDGARKVEKILLRGEPAITCDTVIFATGIKPNSLIAREAGIAVGQGVKINNRLETNQADIFAIGECAEFNGRIFGLVAPGLEQAGVLARNLACDDSAVYKESLLSANLKVVRTPVFSTGEVGEDYSHGIYKQLVYDRDGIYRKLVLSRGRLVGAIALGNWPEQDLIKSAIGRRAYLLPFRQWLFKSSGAVFSDASDPTRVPDQAIICNCRQIPAGDIRSALSAGCQTVEAIGLQCGAGTVCGSCQPILATFTQQNSFKAKSQLVLATWGLAVAALIAAFFLLPPLPIAAHYDPQALDKWWTETDHRQITGFTTLGMMSLGLLVGLRKRIRWFRWLKFDRWRWLHVILSTLCVGLLFVHTGLGSAQGLNRWLLWSFMLAAAMGVGTSVLSHLESRWPGIANKTFKRWFTTAHLASFWPMPVLLALHILTVYWF